MNLVVAFLIAVVIRSLLVQPFFIPSESMTPTLLTGDYVFVMKADYGYSRYSFPFALDFWHGRFPPGMPRRGDVVVFRGGAEPGEDYVKRVIGLPGDKVQLADGLLYVNGQAAAMRDEGNYAFDALYGRMAAREYEEILPGGARERILKMTDEGFPNNTPVYTVPPGELFVLGDNRDDSLDSRYSDVAYVPVENVVGRVVLVWFSVNDAPSAAQTRAPRWNRILRLVS